MKTDFGPHAFPIECPGDSLRRSDKPPKTDFNGVANATLSFQRAPPRHFRS